MLKFTATGLAGFLNRVTSVIRLVRPVDPPAPPYKTCAGCGRGGRDDQAVPDPDQYTRSKTVADTLKTIGDPAEEPEPIERAKDGTDITTIDAAPVWCGTCRAWFHAIRCYSLHHAT